ncbi:hypothetical protein D9758_000831 [Tetrapyrgos nigripes]|uniref:Uncharacterized protein n=1 Tax=Tetrapyrgos nigripes TaxID=182062 RepID=A0A8H5GZG1_9AGAR|nr:hypothetical protein D9758_000831 [Tetrapyrgos nigripes]
MPLDHEPPRKKRKVSDSTAGFSGPDGFSKPRSSTTPKITAPVFESAFDTPQTRKRLPLTNTKPTSNETFRPAITGDVGPQSEKRRPLVSGIPKFIVGSSRDTPNSVSSKPTSSSRSNKSSSTSLDILKPFLQGAPSPFDTPSKPPSKSNAVPIPLPQPQPHVSKPTSNLRKLVAPSIPVPETPASKLHLRTLAPPVIPSPVTPVSSSSKPTSKLKPLHPPVISSVVPETPSKPLKGLPSQLSLLQPNLNPNQLLKTIGTTRVARATDLSLSSAEGGTAELASIFLHDAHSEIVKEPQDEPESQRGLNVSPQKGSGVGTVAAYGGHGGGKGPKFIKDGLAAKASMILSYANTSLALWTNEFSVSSNYVKPDLRIRVVKVIHTPKPANSLTIKSLPGLAICCLSPSPTNSSSSASSAQTRSQESFPYKPAAKFHSEQDDQPPRPVLAKFPLDLNERLSQFGESQSQPNSSDNSQLNTLLFLTLFSFSPRPTPASTPVRNPTDLEDGTEFYVWKPWGTHGSLSEEHLRSFAEVFSGSGAEGLRDVTTGRVFSPENLESSVLFVDRFAAARRKE